MPSCKTPQGLKTHAPNSPPPSPQPATPNRTSRSRPPPHTHPCRVVSHSTLSTARHRPIGRGRCLFGGEITHEKNTIRRQFCRRTCYIGFCTRRCTQMELKKKKKKKHTSNGHFNFSQKISVDFWPLSPVQTLLSMLNWLLYYSSRIHASLLNAKIESRPRKRTVVT